MERLNARAGAIDIDAHTAPRALSANALPRRELVARLQRTAGCRLVAVAAPAGYGKSHVCAQWARADERAVVWLNVVTRHRVPDELARM